ncbi:septum formation initiator family protein [Sandarakinorhabdus sp.]|uniref:FtsB family cell division protein n=1 Tax=Sandarakinorhabdus sp. TaxID=1916663 RepID=UPI00286E68F5|nr:septum formation initiator family protein [Sandarakinorhabdus sp.]
MQGRSSIRELFRVIWLPALCLVLTIGFVSRAVTGPTGLMAWREYQAQRQALLAETTRADETKAALARQVALLDPRKVDPDLADELVRRNLNMVRPDEVIVPVPNN